MDDANVKGAKVVLEAKKHDSISLGQVWNVASTSDGWLTFKNSISGRYLTAENSSRTTITGILLAFLMKVR